MHVAVWGTGDWARVHLAALSASTHVDRVMLVGRNTTALAELAAAFPIVRETHSDERRMLDDASVSVVHIVLPHDLHAACSQAALAAGKHVICEKPGATRLADLDATLAAARVANKRLLIVMNQLYSPVYQRLRAEVATGSIGRPFLSVENSFSDASGNYRRRDYWRNTPDRCGGGILIDGGFHMMYRHLYTVAPVARPEWVLADTAQLNVDVGGSHEPAKGEDFVSMVVGCTGGLRLQLAHGWTLAATPTRNRQSFLAGSEGTLELTDDPQQPLLLRRSMLEKQDHAKPPIGVPLDVPAGPRSGTETTQACLLDNLDALATGRELPDASLNLARTTLATILAAYASGASGKREPVA